MEAIIDIINEMSPYLLLGFLLAGLMHAFLPGQLYSRYLAKPSFRSVANAALFGIPLPLCSCGVIPTAMSLRREGASKGAAVSFLIATPQTGVDSIIATFSLMGLPFALIRPLAALLTALFGGQMVNVFGSRAGEQQGEEPHSVTGVVTPHCDCGCEDDDDDCHCHEHSHESHASEGFFGRLREAFNYAFVEMMEDIGRWLVVGLVVAGLLTVLIPDDFFAQFADYPLLAMLLVLLFSIPMYLCATGSIPIAVALMLKGLTPGAALVLLMAGPASNMASILVIRKVLGMRTLVVYLASIVGGAILFGLGIDYLLPREWFTSSLVAHDACCHEEPGIFSSICSVALTLLLLNALRIKYTHGHKHHHSHAHDEAASNSKTTNNANASDNMTQTYIIEGMNCNHCRMAAEKALRSVAGVVNASVTLETKKAVVEGSASREELAKAVEEIGFTLK